MKRALLILSSIFLTVGVGIFIFDGCTSHRYGFHLNEVAGVTDTGDPIDWPTGERPRLMMIPVFIYGIAFCILALGIFLLRSSVGQSRCNSSGRVLRGAE
jgi:hypothetical protein